MTVNLNPWAKEFFPPSQYSFAYPLLPLPPSPPSFLPPPTVNTPTPISYNIFSPLQLQMNYMPPISPPSFPVMGCPIPFPPVNTHFPCEIIIDPLLNISVCPSQQGLMASPQPQPQPQPQPCAGAHSRSLLLTCVPPQLTEEDLRRNLRTWGPIRALHLQKKYEGVVIVDYFDLRHANEALADIQQGRQFIGRGWGMKGGKSICAEYARPTAQNQGTLVVFNLDATMSPHCIRSYFQRYGALKEVRESPLNRQVKFVEFFDVRDACRALEALDETVIGSKPVKILFSHLGSRALRGASTSYNRPPRQQHIYNFKWINGKQACSYQAGVTNILRDQTNMATSIEGWAADSIPNGETGSFPEITGESFTQFAFDEDEALSNSAQARTTIMIKNIPNKYDLDMILKVLDSHCMQCNEQITGADESFSEYDFVYLPIDFKNRCNLGYAFVNFTSAKATWKFYKDFDKRNWAEFNSKKICEITYARLQGRRHLEDHFQNARLECDTDNYLPLVFDPPRNGRNFTVTRVIRSLWQGLNYSNKCQHVHHYSRTLGKNHNRGNSDYYFTSSGRGRSQHQTFYRVKSAASADNVDNQS